MVFTKDTTFLNLVRGEREHENYGVTHTIKHVFVDEKENNRGNGSDPLHKERGI